MKFISRRSLFLLTLGILFVVSSCRKEPDSFDSYQYLIDYQKLNTLQNSFIAGFITTASILYPEVLELQDSMTHSVAVYKLIYKTTYKGEQIEASGLINVPMENGNFPILSFQNGTNTSHAKAPTESSSSSDMLLLSSLASTGYILLIPDYIGFGTSEYLLHPYYQKETSNSAVLDFIIAAKEFIDHYDGAAGYTDEFFLMGYSQGGWATLAALEEIEHNPSSGLNIAATSCGAGAYDLMQVSSYILDLDIFPGPLYLPYFIYSHQQYGTLSGDLSLFFQEPYASLIPSLFDGSHTNTQVNDQLTDSIAILLNPEFIADFQTDTAYAELRNELSANSIEAWPVISQLRFYHGDEDLNVPPFESENMYNEFLSRSGEEKVEHFVMSGLNHETGVVPWGVETIKWFSQERTNDQ